MIKCDLEEEKECRRDTDPTFDNNSSSSNSDFYVTVQLYGDNKPLTVPVRTSYKAFTNHYS